MLHLSARAASRPRAPNFALFPYLNTPRKPFANRFPAPLLPLAYRLRPTQGSTHRPLFPFAEQPPSRNFTLLSLRGKDTSSPQGLHHSAAGFARRITDTPVEASACLNSRETTARRKLSPLAVTAKQPPCRRTLPTLRRGPFLAACCLSARAHARACITQQIKGFIACARARERVLRMCSARNYLNRKIPTAKSNDAIVNRALSPTSIADAPQQPRARRQLRPYDSGTAAGASSRPRPVVPLPRQFRRCAQFCPTNSRDKKII